MQKTLAWFICSLVLMSPAVAQRLAPHEAKQANELPLTRFEYQPRTPQRETVGIGNGMAARADCKDVRTQTSPEARRVVGACAEH